jgi:hypothetical protein
MPVIAGMATVPLFTNNPSETQRLQNIVLYNDENMTEMLANPFYISDLSVGYEHDYDFWVYNPANYSITISFSVSTSPELLRPYINVFIGYEPEDEIIEPFSQARRLLKITVENNKIVQGLNEITVKIKAIVSTGRDKT